jgi:hypothetical protein
MIVVAIVSVDLAAARVLYAYHRSLLPGVVLSGLSIQWGIFQLILGRPRLRLFWAGFVGAGALGCASLLLPESRYWTTWYGYFLFAGDFLELVPGLAQAVKSDRRASLLIFTVVVSLPQLLMGLAGGLLVQLSTWSIRDPDSTRQEHSVGTEGNL